MYSVQNIYSILFLNMIDYDPKSTVPPSPPPSIEPQYSPILRQPEYETIQSLLKTYVYIWLKNGGSLWFYPVSFYDNMIYGYVWMDNHWEAIALSYDYIDCIY